MVIHGKAHNLEIQLVPAAGSDKVLNLIDQNGADLGLIPGAIEDRTEA